MIVQGAPWKFSPWHIEEGPPAVLAADGWYVCTTSSDEHARLIAAAPDLAKYLELALFVIEKGGIAWFGEAGARDALTRSGYSA